MSSNLSNPFSRPSPFAFSRQSSSSSYPYTMDNLNTRIAESQVRPGLAGLSSRPSLTNNYTGSYSPSVGAVYGAYGGIGAGYGGSGYGARGGVGSAALGVIDEGRGSYLPDSYALDSTTSRAPASTGLKSNPFQRSSLIPSSSYLAALPTAMPTTLPKESSFTSDFDNNYAHLRYTPSSYSPVTELPTSRPVSSTNLDPSLRAGNNKYNPNTYATVDKDDNNSVYSYINKVNDLVDQPRASSPFSRKNVVEGGGYGRRDVTRDPRGYEELKYSVADKAKFEEGVGYSNGLDRLRYEYSREKKQKEMFKEDPYNQYKKLQAKEDQYIGLNPKKDGSEPRFNEGYLYQQKLQNPYTRPSQPKQKTPDYSQGARQGIYDREPEPRARSKSRSPPRNYVFQDFHDDDASEEEPSPKYNRYGGQPIKSDVGYGDFKEDKEFNFNRRESIEYELERMDRINREISQGAGQWKDTKYDEAEYDRPTFAAKSDNFAGNGHNKIGGQEHVEKQPYAAYDPYKYESPQFGLPPQPSPSSKLPLNGPRSQDYEIVRFDEDDEPEGSVPVSDSQVRENRGAFPSTLLFHNVEYFKIPLGH